MLVRLLFLRRQFFLAFFLLALGKFFHHINHFPTLIRAAILANLVR